MSHNGVGRVYPNRKYPKRSMSTTSTALDASQSLNLALAWKRVGFDHPDRCFVQHPYLFSWLEYDLQSFLISIKEQLRAGYVPQDCIICEVPKGGWMVRPGAVLNLSDEVVFNAIVGRYEEAICEALIPYQGDPDIAYQLQASGKTAWIKRDFSVWREWRNKSLEKLSAKGIQFVLFTDISAFYENIDLGQLGYDLRMYGFESPHLDTLITCLKRWAQPRRKGIPQGYSASDILAKLYLNPIDRALQKNGFLHLRYVDDIRIFCRTRLEAKRALICLNRLLRNRGLNLQTAKTKILDVEKARYEIDGVAPVVESIQSQLSDQLKDVYAAAGYDVSLSELAAVVGEDPESPALAVLERAFEDHILVSSAESTSFDKTLFHFVVNRLGRCRSRVAVEYCIRLLASHPEETEHVLRYLGAIVPTEDDERNIARYAGSSDAVYDYQLYQICRWFLQRGSYPPSFVKLCRRWFRDLNREPWLRVTALAVLGNVGDYDDLESIESQYATVASELGRAEIVAALKQMETSRRNAFYARVRTDGDLIRRATSVAKRAT
jgi:hypothetical protein